MVKGKTVVVIGAGASAEAELPVGAMLANDIARLVDLEPDDFGHLPETTYVKALKHAVREQQGVLDTYLQAGRLIRDARPSSIDNFIDQHRDNKVLATCGKLGIACVIAQAEAESPMVVSDDNAYNRLDLQRFENTWFSALGTILMQGCTADELRERLRGLTFIVFNYDRCIEHYLMWRFRINYNISKERAAELVSQISIIHPYGAIGRLPWQGTAIGYPGPSGPAVEFGVMQNPAGLYRSSCELRTYSEKVKDDLMLDWIRPPIREADFLLFLGFSFGQDNMKLLLGDDRIDKRIRIVATGKGQSESSCLYIANNLKQKFRGRNQIQVDCGKTCRDLFHDHWQELSLSAF